MSVVFRDVRPQHAGEGVRGDMRAVVVAIAFALVAFVCVLCLGIFFVAHAHHGVARTLARVIPIPAAVVDGRVVSYREVSERANALETLSGLSPDDAIAQALVLAQRRAVLEALAQRLSVPEPRRDDAAAQEALEHFSTLETRAGWTQRDVWRYAARPFLLATSVEDAAREDEYVQATARGRMESIVHKYEEGIAFADLALQYSEGDSASLGGSLGYVDPLTLPEELHTVVPQLGINDTSSIVQTPYAFWFVMVEDILVGDDATLFALRVIEIKKDLLADVLDEALTSAKIREFVF